MKTPQQIAKEVVDRLPLRQDPTYGEMYVEFDPDELVETIAAAIQRDREHRPTLDKEEFDQITEAMSALVRGLERGREYITLDDAREAEELIRDKFGPALHEDWGIR